MFRLATEDDAREWNGFVDSHENRTFAHRWQWSTVFANSYRITPRYFMARENDIVTGILPTVILKSRLFGKYMISLPWLDYGGPLGSSVDISTGLVDFASDVASEEKCDFVELRAVRQSHPRLLNKAHKFSFILDLSPGEETVWKSLDSKCRNQVRKAAKSGLEVRFGGIEYLDHFYKIFCRNMRDLGTPVWPKKLFSEQLDQFEQDTEIVLVYLENVPIACGLLIHYGDYSTVPSASSYREYLKLSPNNIMYWEVIKRCISRGTKRFDFGRSSLDAGTYHFKKQWVKDPEPLIWQYNLLSVDEVPGLNPSNPKLRLAIEIWKRLPLGFANLIGPTISVKLP